MWEGLEVEREDFLNGLPLSLPQLFVKMLMFYLECHLFFYLFVCFKSFLVEENDRWIEDKNTLVDYLKSIWNSAAYHSQISRVRPLVINGIG